MTESENENQIIIYNANRSIYAVPWLDKKKQFMDFYTIKCKFHGFLNYGRKLQLKRRMGSHARNCKIDSPLKRKGKLPVIN